MGRIGRKLGRLAGGEIGKFAGKRLGKYTGIHAEKGYKVGRRVGGILGDLLPFKKGGRVKRKTQKALLHQGEFVLPKGVKPTKKQVRSVKKRGGRM